MKKTLIFLSFLGLLLIAVSCSDPAADELYDLKKPDPTTSTVGDKSPDTDDNPPPAH
ncbi:hypothetical protein JMN32_07760 [Fulvivirga sp. 29W222]|uniref:Lipoprotein n=1 Tax=Fulvivirga marina TaxID=2494733 RepID=A0A937FUK9_9BACT|nr:hypothetical protein [Fulvivirga marina]MBL6446199.1 hypothetical protein [Fulvivirga marina]